MAFWEVPVRVSSHRETGSVIGMSIQNLLIRICMVKRRLGVTVSVLKI